MDAARTKSDEARVGFDVLKAPVGILDDELDMARTGRDQTSGELQTGCPLLFDFVPTAREMRGRMGAVTIQIREMEAAPQNTVVMVAWFRGEMADRYWLMQAWYRVQVIARAPFAAR